MTSMPTASAKTTWKLHPEKEESENELFAFGTNFNSIQVNYRTMEPKMELKGFASKTRILTKLLQEETNESFPIRCRMHIAVDAADVIGRKNGSPTLKVIEHQFLFLDSQALSFSCLCIRQTITLKVLASKKAKMAGWKTMVSDVSIVVSARKMLFLAVSTVNCKFLMSRFSPVSRRI